MPYGCEILLQSDSKFSIHCSDEFSFTARKKGVHESDCFCVPNANPKTDAFACMPVNSKPIEDYFWVSEMVPTLEEFVAEYSDGQKVDLFRHCSF